MGSFQLLWARHREDNGLIGVSGQIGRKLGVGPKWSCHDELTLVPEVQVNHPIPSNFYGKFTRGSAISEFRWIHHLNFVFQDIGKKTQYFWMVNDHPNILKPVQQNTLDIPNPPNTLVNGYLEPLKAEPQEMLGGSNTYSQGIWMSRDI